VHRIATDASLLAAMRIAARQSAMSVSWDAVFENVYLAYERPFTLPEGRFGPQPFVAGYRPEH